MKLKRADLKQLIKECVMEILVEGFGDNLAALTESHKQQVTTVNKKRLPKSPPLNEHNAIEPPMSMTQVFADDAEVPVDHKNAAISSLTDDPIMASIFSDTAATTLTEQAGASKHVSAAAGGDKMAQAAAQLDPTQLEGSNNWAKLAFDN